MFKKLTRGCVNLVEKYLPDAFIFAIFLTIIVFLLALINTGKAPLDLVGFWGKGFWGLLSFSMQMILVLITGHALAQASIFKNLLKKIASIAKTPVQAILLVTFVSAICCWLNWGFGLVIGALLAKELARQVRGLDYRLLIASAYSGFLVWHGGLSGSIPLKVVEANGGLKGVTFPAIPVSQTLFSSTNLTISIILILTLPLINMFMMPKKEDVIEFIPEEDGELAASAETQIIKIPTAAQKLENSMFMSLIISILGFAYIIKYFINGGSLSLDSINMIFLFTGILLHKTPLNYVKAIENSIKGAGGIALQFPFYGGIMGIMVDSGLAANIANWFVNVSSIRSFPVYTFLSAGLVNLFIPSGGGQWAAQGPIVMDAAQKLGVPLGKAAMALAWGDAWTNMIQPFWALPILGLAKLGARDIMGYCLMDLIYSGIVIALIMYLV
ncbi:short-chain fatty acid transporter [Fervidicella metallireducens AeB]|uniref:Short-chain fatty acid transporter n=1 Tax=Fervidicella metallireducens AeB TaxID=1403537 RepID=A0A017RW20_9CLOT|nr:short-chain fatty acid transporter [Fervidicella metallireducens]EYE88968.1 short-chain fatty acid transporter [Fervidicella metallireducens AeB]